MPYLLRWPPVTYMESGTDALTCGSLPCVARSRIRYSSMASPRPFNSARTSLTGRL